MKMEIKRNLIAAMVVLAMVGAAGCSGQTAPDSANNTEADTEIKGEGVVNLYTSRHYDTDEALYDNFTEETGIEVKRIEGKADELIERIKAEGDNSPADVLITVDAGNLWRAEQAGLLQPVSSSTLESAIPENLRHSEGNWFGLSTRARIIVYSKERVQPTELSTYEALAQPKWKGRVCIRSSSNIYNQSLVASKIESKGSEAAGEWVTSLVSNFARPPEGNDTAQIKAVAAGTCDVALVNHYYVARLAKSDKPEDKEVSDKVAAFFPAPTHVNISGAGLVASAPNKDNGIAFLEYLVTPAAQEIFAAGNNEYPIISTVQVTPTLQAFGTFESDEVNVAAYGSNNPDAIEVMDRAGWK